MEEKICQIHKTPLKLTEVPLSYGSPLFDEALIKARKELFPNAKFYLLGGCSYRMESHTEDWICEECRVAETKWRKENKRWMPKVKDKKI